MGPLFHLDWAVCQDGYKLEDRPPVTGGSLIGRRPREIVIVPRSNKYYPTKPLEVPALYRVFAKCKRTYAGVLGFVKTYGMLGSSRAKSETVCYLPGGRTKLYGGYFEAIDNLRSLVRAIEARDWPTLSTWLADLDNHPGGGGLGRMGLLLCESDNGQREIRLRPSSLGSALQVQAIADATIGAEHRKCKCPGCLNYFRIGRSGGGLRRGAEYCSPKCQKAHAYMQRKEHAR
jgi:hypothetical protein